MVQPAIAKGIAVMPGLDGENIPVTGRTCPIAPV